MAMLMLLCGAALAENFRCELPDGAYVSDTTPLQEGDNLLLATYGGLYRMPLTGGDAEKLADVPNSVSHQANMRTRLSS